jgi:periplasmic copper chaperone A
MLPRPLIFAWIALGFAAAAHAEEPAVHIRILAAWARATPGPTAAVYLELRNESREADRLVEAWTPLAERVEFHEHRSSGGIMSMAAVPDILLPPAQTVRLSPGQRHLMLFRIQRPLAPGDRFALTLRFAEAGDIRIEAVTAGPGALQPPS